MEQILQRLYKYPTEEQQIIDEHSDVKLTTKIDLVYGQGVLKYHKGAEMYPEKGLTEPKAMFAANFAKKLLVHTVRLSKWSLFMYKDVIGTYVELAERIIKPYIIHLHFMPPVARNLTIFFTKFLQSIGISQYNANRFAEIIGTIIALDDAYRFRLQDIASETTKEKLSKNPRRELLRLLRIYKVREGASPAIAKKILAIKPIIYFGMLIPKFKKAFIDAIQQINMEEMAYDENDRYWVALNPEYIFFGKTLEERKVLMEGKPQPKVMTRERWNRYSKKHHD